MTEDKLARIVSDVLGLDSGSVSGDISREDVDSWDSLSHLRLITAVENEFGISLTMDQIAGISRLSDIQRIVQGQA